MDEKMDNGRIRIENYKGVVYCEWYLDTEYTAEDGQSMIDEIQKNFTPPANIILKKAGSYSFNVDGQLMLMNKVEEFGNFIYVVDNATKRASAEYAVSTYMKQYNSRVAVSKEEAYMMLMDC